MTGLRRGAYAPLSATYAADDAVMEAGEAAELLFVRGLAFCASSDSDGFMTRQQVIRYVGAGMKDAEKRAARLVEVGLWAVAEGGWLINAWLKWNPSAEEKGRAKRRDRERKAAAKPPEGAGTPPSPDPEPPEDSSDPSERNPNGIQAESNGNGARNPCLDTEDIAEQIQKTPRTLRNPTEPDPFDALWEVYPRREDKGHARKAWPGAVRKAGSPEPIITAAAQFAEYTRQAKTERTFIPLPATWLNGERWNDQLPPVVTVPDREW